MEISIFLAKIIGLYLIIDGLIAVTRQKDLIPIIEQFKNSKAGMLLLGVFLFVVGLLITTTHNIWSGAAFQVVLTLLGWIILLKGLFLSLMPVSCMSKLITKFNKPVVYKVVGPTVVLIGVWLAISGFIL